MSSFSLRKCSVEHEMSLLCKNIIHFVSKNDKKPVIIVLQLWACTFVPVLIPWAVTYREDEDDDNGDDEAKKTAEDQNGDQQNKDKVTIIVFKSSRAVNYCKGTLAKIDIIPNTLILQMF